jgi:hypothetical protein
VVSLLNLETDDSKWPVPCTAIKGPFTPESVESMIAFLDSFTQRKEDYVHVIVIDHYSINMKVMKELGKWQVQNRAETAQYCRGVVVCVENIKGFQLVLNTLLNITPTNYPIEVVEGKEDALFWAEERLNHRISA